jgi:mannose-6-phosphate isomerase-like protein (cupin superfamily)
MNSPVSISNAEHYLWGDKCEGWLLLENEDMSVIQESVPAGRSEVMHYHLMSRQFFYILEGEGTMILKDQSIILQKGEGLEIPPGILHQFTNPSQTEVRFLVISVPKNHGDRINI